MGNTRPYRGTMLAHLALLMLLVSTVSSQSATVSFVESAITIQEGGAATVGVQKTGDSPGEVRVVVGFQDRMAANADFVGNNFVLSFPAGSATSVQEGTFYSSDDDNPEPDEPFSVTMTVISGGAVIGDPSTTTVTIAANDDAFGVIGFDVVSPMRVTEEQSSTTLLLPLKRERGTFGLVAVTYQITGGSGTASEDLTPVTGSVTISQGISTDALRIVILADLIPEDDEEFTVELTSVSGGATLNASSQSVLLIINANDSPLRFAQPQYSFPENAGTVTVEVQRGLDTDGLTPLGPSDQTVTVEYWFYSGSAKLGVDCVVTNGSLGFSPGEMTKTISIAILDDPTPELAEEFSISLANPSTNAVLVEPVTTVVAILPNDDQHGVLSLSSENSGSSPKAVINEDTTFSTSSFTVVREGGTFGEVSIDYIITRNDSSSAPIATDLAPASGTVTLPESQRSQSILINIIDDPVPEEAEQFIISLLPDSVTGDASVGAVTEGLLTIQDSDDAYGVIQFSSDVEQRIVTSTRPRQLQLMLTRAAGVVGQVSVSFSVVYRLPSQDPSSVGSIDVIDGAENQTTVIPGGSTVHPFQIQIKADSFLSLGATFQVTLLSVRLLDHATLLPPSSPRLGDRTAVSLEVTSGVANGEIGFERPNQRLFVDEPDGTTPTLFPLDITREGTSGDATIYWRIISSPSYPVTPTQEDISAFSGSVFIASGIARTQIVLEILPDDLAETDETMIVQLYNVQPGSQILRQGDTEAVVTIRENDGPGGYFEFSPLTPGPFVISEGGDLVQVTILRNGGSLVARSVRYFAAGDSMTSPEFYGLPQVVTFNPGETEKNISFVAAPDSIPELNETFQLTLATFGNPPSDLGDLTTIQVTVLENDDPHGVFTFPEDPMIRHIDESKGTDIYSARFPVLRDAGVFGQANVSWAVVTTGAALDISPLSGVLTYGDGISLQEIEITARADEIPENPETFQLTLTNPAGESRLGSVTTATLNINKNDDAIFFEDPIAKTVAEPGAVAFTVRRNGTAASVASVDYRTVAGSATDGLFDYATVAGTLQFPVGVRTQRVAVRILDDNTPEDDEYFTIQLYNPMGDVVVYGAPTATVTIAANDDPYGIFSFREPLTRVFASEGTSVFTEIQRARGNFGTVQVHWQIVYNGTSEPVPAGTEFEVVAGTVEFTDQQSLQRIQVTSRMDGVPEFAEYYELLLVNVTDGALSDTDPIAVSLEISANDDPYGVLVFPSSSTERDIAEDYYPEDNATGRAVFTVERAQGSFGEVEVLWEVFSDSISGILPTVRDLIFLAEPNPSVSPQPSSGRLHTGTQAMFFDGGTNSYLRVPSQYQLPTADTVSGFSLSAWVRPDADVDGFVLSKLSTDGITVHYGLKLAARPGGMIMVHYRYSGSSFTNTVIDFALSSVDLADGLWHSIILTIDSSKATLYVDGSLIAERTMDQAQGDGPGELYVGALQPGTERYKGLLQDVRMYARKLQEREIVEIWTSPSKQDLTPISGKLTFDPGQRSADITMESLDDTEEEGNEVFTVMLLCSSGGGRIGRDDATALLTVLKSDNANGLFGFDGPCTPTSFDPESNEALQYTCSVIRSRGDEGVVTIPWEVRNLATDEVASDDFVNATGEVVFPNGVRTQTITLTAIDDMQPELLETFSIILLPRLPLSDDGLIGTTDTSGASIDPDASANNLTIQANDFPYGLLQFATGPPPGTADPLIPPAAEMVRVRVREEEGMVRLLVVRAQGLLGEVQVEWRTIDGSALSAGKDPVDFVSGGGTLTFADQQRFLYITIAINDNNIAELDKTFQVQLSSPTQGAEVGIGSTVEVTIEGSDNAYGTFQFADVSLVVTATEMDVGSTVTTLQVLRLGGALAEVTVDWVVTSDPNDPDANVTNDLLQSRGSVTFGVDEMTADISLEIASDELPELDESFYVQLRNASDGRLGDPSKLVATVTVAANDDPYGAFIFEANSRSVVVGEEFRNVSLTIQRQFGSEGVVQVVYSTLNAEENIPNMPAYISRARENVDFIPTRSSVIFSPGQLSSDVSVVLLDDTEPETAESLFVYIVSVNLLSSPQANPVIDSPRVGAEHIAEVYIQANDDANGVLQLSASTVRVSEESMQPFLNVTRVAGSFGTVTVTFQHIPGTAQQGLDYSVTSTNVIMYDGETHKAIPIEILNDRVPEVAESFQVVLLDQITGGAILGSPATCEVTIEPSDDPYGSFGFGFTNVQANEPEQGNSRQLSLSVIRNGGDIGVVAVIWEARINGVLAMDDVFPTGGTLYFLSFDVSQTFTLDILPDDIPEERETVILTLVNATGGGVIGNPPTATISIEANDNPHGIVEFTLANNIVQEVEGGDTVASIMVTRSAGTFGDLQVTFDTRPLDLIQEVTQNGETAMDYYQLPITGSQMGVSMTTIDVTGQSNPLLACAQECLRERACGSFTYRIFSGDAMCLWTVSTATDNVDATSGFRLFVKDLVKAQALYDSQAVPGLDYIPINSGSVRIPDGMASGYLNVTIRDDATPERDEIFNMRLASVTLVGPTPQPNNLPTLGTQRETRVTIASNDDANGVWRIYSNSPEAVNGQLVLVTETVGVSVSVELVVERQGGSIGDVSVSWQAVAGTATEGDDYSASGGTLNFASGQTRQVINIGIRDDTIPEIDETFSVELYNPTGGSELGLHGRVDIRILANDYVAGILKLSTLSYIVREGEGFNVTVDRSSPGLGQVTVDWTISGVNGQVPTQSFQQTNGSLAFAPGQLLEAILLSVLSDDTPEVNEEFQVTLSNVQTMGISLTGAATLDPQGSTASVTIQASDEPHGVFSFAQGSEVVMVAEGNTTVQLFVDRKFGSIGRVRVFYEAKEGSLDPSLPALNRAQDGLDFVGGPNYLDFEEGQSVGEITVPINEDDIPELNEVFLVNLTDVQILDPATDTPPRLDSSGTLSQVTIEANDGTQGVVLFSGITGSLDTIEAERTLQLTVSRDRGTYGAVTVFVYSQPVDARKGSDYSFSDQVLSFGDGETTRTINVAIFDDDIAEADETFELILNNPTGGLQLGDPAKVTIRILASDDAFGIINFASPLTVTIQEPSDTDTSNSVAQLTLVRSRGTFGDVQVPFAVVDQSGSRGVIDLTPVDGFVTIAAGESTGVLHISATPDDIPELEERFQVLLATPQGGAMLGDSNNATIIIQRNDAPYGSMQVFPTGSRQASLDVEEENGTVYFTVERSGGHIGIITVDWQAVPDTATAQAGDILALATVQRIASQAVRSWCSYNVGQDVYLVMVSGAETGQLSSQIGSDGSAPGATSVLYRWQGEFVPVQSIETDGGVACTSYDIQGTTYLVIANHGSTGRYETMSRIYRVNQDGTLYVMQDVATKGATDATFFTIGSDVFLVLANGLTNAQLTVTESTVLLWTGVQFVAVGSLATTGAAGVEAFNINGDQYLAMANSYDSSQASYEIKSLVYKWESGSFTEYQQLDTLGAVDVESFSVGTAMYLVFANSRNNEGASNVDSYVYRWNPSTSLFVIHQTIPTQGAQSVTTFLTSSGSTYLVIANAAGDSVVMEWEPFSAMFMDSLSLAPAYDVVPFTVTDYAGRDLVMLASANFGDGVSVLDSMILQIAGVTESSDFIPRSGRLTFQPEDTELTVAITILDDDRPEDDEYFRVVLSNPTGGAELGRQDAVMVDILSNDDAHGIIGFAQDSLNIQATEQATDTAVIFTLERQRGTSGVVVVAWVASGEHDPSDIRPPSGMVEFADGVSTAAIVITVTADSFPELDETSTIQLTSIVNPGTTHPGRGAVISDTDSTAMLTVLANDSPHGVFAWTLNSLFSVVNEPEGSQPSASVVLHILREQGSLGAVNVRYKTSRAAEMPELKQAEPNRDFVSQDNYVRMEDGVTSASLTIAILPDTDSEGPETFLVNLTSVDLVTGTPVGGAAPSIKNDQDVAEITITQNDNANGILQLNASKNSDGDIEVYEGSGTSGVLSLPVSRTAGAFGQVGINWLATTVSASTADFSPLSGNVTFIEGQREAFIEIAITDDTIYENDERFTVSLHNPSGGAVLGAETSVIIKILKNDSPKGLFGFLYTQETVMESLSPSDPSGEVTLIIERSQGTQGIVEVDWALEPLGRMDLSPAQGSLTFQEGATRRTITLRAVEDTVLEGEERYTVTIQSVTDDAEISPVFGTTTIVIQPDAGSSGLIAVLPQSRYVLIGEPTTTHDGTASLHLTRGAGIFSQVTVNWQLSPRDGSTFRQTSGTVVFEDLQQNATIMLQTIDDSIPETKQTYILQLSSITGGAAIDPDSQANQATVIVVASDNPHGVFEFSGLPEVVVSEDLPQVSLDVVRNAGITGAVKVTYTTKQISAQPGEDYVEDSGDLIFSEGVDVNAIKISLVPDDLPEGPESFLVNLTSIELLQPVNNDYTLRGGLSLDMPPVIGSFSEKTVTIAANDNAQGIIEFAQSNVFEFSEGVGTAVIPVVRTAGTFGLVQVSYTSRNLTATPGGVDYSLTDGAVSFLDGQSQGSISVAIIDDQLKEFAEVFEITLTETLGGAVLGRNRTATVVISKSDGPDGLIGFSLNQLERILPNPENNRNMEFTIELSGGIDQYLTGAEVRWRILDPNSQTLPPDTSDISTSGGQLQGSVTFDPGQRGAKSFTLRVKPYPGPEVEETFTIEIYQVVGAGEISEEAGRATLKILKHGDPNGVVRFYGESINPRSFDEPGDGGSLKVAFPLRRREGVVGDINVYWEARDMTGQVASDVSPPNGTLRIPDGVANTQILLNILPDQIPELQERFQLVLVSVDGGAEIDPQFNTSTFYIQPNDNPHGVFSVHQENQTVGVNANMKRYLRIYVTRSAGTEGDVSVTFDLKYNDGITGAYVPSSSSVVCRSGNAFCTKDIPLLNNDMFLERDTSFNVTLTSLSYLGPVEVTIPPVMLPGAKSALIVVPQEAANSLVGFKMDATTVDDISYRTVLTIERIGSYGTIDVLWQAGYPSDELPQGYLQGAVSQGSGQLNMGSGVSTITLPIVLNPSGSPSELFAAHLTSALTSAEGGARLRGGYTTAPIEPYGVVGFTQGSRGVTVSEGSGELSLTVERQLGTLGSVRVTYQTHAASAIAGEDYVTITSGALTMATRAKTANILVTILEEQAPELAKVFYVNITSVARLPIDGTQGTSPRLSSRYPVSEVTIEGSNDPYGVLNMDPDVIEIAESEATCKHVTLNIQRSGGSHGEVSIRVRTIGGGEPWQSSVAQRPSDTTNTIENALANTQDRPHATAGQDYEQVDVAITFRDGETEKSFRVQVCDDGVAEPAELFFVYLSEPTGGARVAQGQPDGGLKGFTHFTIVGSDNFNGVIGFAEESRFVTVDEDVTPSITLTLDRGQAFFGEVTVEWRATYSAIGDITNDADLYNQLEQAQGMVTCPADQRLCTFDITLRQDEEPEFASWFLVELVGVGQGASLDQAQRLANITTLDSDYPYGLLQFTTDTRFQSVHSNTKRVSLRVERIGGSTKDSAVSWGTFQLDSPIKLAGLTAYPAIADTDYVATSGVLDFSSGIRRIPLDVVLLPETPASSAEYPKLLQVRLMQATNGAGIHADYGTASITLVEDERTADIWDNRYSALVGLNNDNIYNILLDMAEHVKAQLTEEQLAVVVDTIRMVVAEGGRRKLPSNLLTQLMDIYCTLMNPDRQDTRGAYQLAESFSTFAFILVTDLPCETQDPQTLSCDHVVVETGRWSRGRINGHNFQGKDRNSFTMPTNLLDTSASSSCEDIHFIEYSSQQWFYGANEASTLNNQVLSVAIKGAEQNFTRLSTPVTYRIYTDNARVTPRGASCVIFNGPTERWRPDSCQILTQQGAFVECSCTHLSEYAAQGETDNLVGYNVYIYVSCFICIAGLVCAIIAHNVCSVYSMFSAKLLIHMCFAAMSLQVVFVTSAYVSSYISTASCAVLGVLIHFFFLAQFTWMLVQAFNLWKVFVINDEHTERYYILFFVIGWCLPVVAIVIYVVITYAVFDWPFLLDTSIADPSSPAAMYGDVHLNGDICFMPNGYAALASAVGPAILCLFGVATVFTNAYQVKPQWKRYDDIYMGSYNTTEVQLLLVFWAIIFLTCLFGGLHMAYSYLWLLIVFVIFNIVQGLYAFVVYTILRNQICRPRKGNYSLNPSGFDNSVMLLDNSQYVGNGLMAAGSEKGSRVLLTKAEQPPGVTIIGNHDEWDTQSLGRQSQHSQHSHHSQHSKTNQSQPSRPGSVASRGGGGNRSRPGSIQNNLYAPAPFQDVPAPLPPTHHHDDDTDSQDFDDLIFALKTGGAYVRGEEEGESRSRPSSRVSSNWQDDSQMGEMMDVTGDATQDHYEMRRIQIADTHL